MGAWGLSPVQQVVAQVATTRGPWAHAYTNTVLSDLDETLSRVRKLRTTLGVDWDPVPTYQFHLALAVQRLEALNPGGGASPVTYPGAPTGPTVGAVQ